MECVRCDGKFSEGCEACGGRGWIPIVGCPKKQITPDIRTFSRLADFAEDKFLPVAGGSLDQTASFMEAFHFWTCELASLRRRE